MIIRTRIFFTIIFSLFIYTSAFSQLTTGQVRAGFHAEGIKLLGGVKDGSNISYLGGLSLGIALSPTLLFELDAGIGWIRPRDNKSQFSILSSMPYKTYLRPWSINLKYYFNKYKKIQPFISLGSGLIHWNLRDITAENQWLPIPESGTSLYGKRHNITIWGSMGISTNISNRICLNLEFKLGRMFHQNVDNIGNGDVNTYLSEVRIGLSVLFNPHKKDIERVVFFEDESSAFSEDSTTLEAKKINFDQDCDGIPDSLDKAPNRAEDFDGFEDEDGIPDMDNDNDGIPDFLDGAPNEAETFNGFHDDDGIPDKKPELVKFIDAIYSAKIFKKESEAITSGGYTILNGITAFMQTHSKKSIEIRSFTNNVKQADNNLVLSQKRAEIVRSYIIKSGIPEKRLHAIGYGEANYISTDENSIGRQQNQRLDFIIIED